MPGALRGEPGAHRARKARWVPLSQSSAGAGRRRWSIGSRSNRSDDDEESHSSVLLRSVVGATQRPRPSGATLVDEGPAVLVVVGCSRAVPNKGGSREVPRETLVDACRKAGAGPFGDAVRG